MTSYDVEMYNYTDTITYTCTNSIMSSENDYEGEEQEEENTMNITTHDERQHLIRRARVINCGKNRELLQAYGIEDDESPETAKEMVKRIQDGMFVLPADEDTDYGRHCIRWRDPAKKRDEKGYKVAFAKLEAGFIATEDDIKILTPEQGLASLRAFEKSTFN